MVSILKRLGVLLLFVPMAVGQANLPSGTTATGYINFKNTAAPSTPSSGKTNVYTDSTSKLFCAKNDAGTLSCTVIPSSAPTHQFFNSLSAGAFGSAQPAFSDLSGSASCSQLPALTGDVTSSAGSCATTLAVAIVSTTGSPVTGDLAKFSGASSITSISAPTICAAGQYAQGIDSSGNASGCTAVSSGGSGSVNNPFNVPVASSPNIPYNGMFLWFSADCITITDANTCAVPSNGTSINLWQERSGHLLAATKQTGTCTFNTSQINGQPAVNFASGGGGSCRMSFYPTASTNGFGHYFQGATTIFAVVKYAGAGAGGFNIDTLLSGTAGAVSYGSDFTKLQRFTDAGSGHFATGTAAFDTSWHQMNVSCDAESAVSFRLDRAADTTILTGGFNCLADLSQTQSTAAGMETLGWQQQCTCGIVNGQIAEVIYYDRMLSSTEITTVETYLNTKYGL